MRYPLWLKLILLITIVFVGAMYAVLKNTNQIFYQDKSAFVLELSSKLSSSTGRLLSDRVTNLQNKLAIFTSNYQSLSPQQKKNNKLDEVIFSQYPEFYTIALLKKSAEGTLQVDWHRVNPVSPLKNWSEADFSPIFLQANKGLQSQTRIFFQPIQSKKGEEYFSMQFSVQVDEGEGKKSESWIFAILPKTTFLDIVSDYKGALNTVFVTDSQGVVYSHPIAAEVSKSYADLSLVSEAINSSKLQGAGDNYIDRDKQASVASYTRLDGMNLYVFTTTPKAEAFHAADELWRSLLIIALGVILIGLVVAFIFAKVVTSPLNRLKKIAAEIGSGNFKVNVDVTSRDEVGDLANSVRQMGKDLTEREDALEHSKKALIQSEKMGAFGQLSAGIAHEVKNPLAGILGHAQLAKSKTKDDDLLKHINFIEKETRRTKEIIENLMKFARAEKLELEPTNLYDTVHGSVDLVEHQLALQGVKLHRHFKRVSPVMGNSNQVQQVMLNLMMNAGHAMESSEKKDLNVYLEDVDDLVRIRIQDSGSGMSKEVQQRIFEPFFTTKPAGKGTGLGLSVSIGIINDHKGKIYVESEEGKGTTFFIDIPKAHDISLPTSVRNENIVEEKIQEIHDIETRVMQMPVEDNATEHFPDITSIRAPNLEESEADEEKTQFPKPPEEISDIPNVEVPVATSSPNNMPASRDYLMTPEQIQDKLKRTKKPVHDEATIADGSFKVKIRKPKTK